ncbi:hypothetical protein JMK10_05010 [Rhodovulum sulfidophilum]|uniref:hypothetical protein n=1 Tax=Rhodovulum sulfidophilum TaxID=35806 RepID=UPI001923A633|nr:hypothetical protein [Rhodovulum sulfidophilum]MBL3575775.1 hypothetical protein [Rhodovulum sulfidophilum]MCE8432609.1 hypothetical protein [Rhodovulum sulfidophilum]MCF4116183.1 hypothetical protein [Rhodovulum sulfidophilum]
MAVRSDQRMNPNFQIKTQEFMNLFAAPAMDLDRSGGSPWRRLLRNALANERSYDIQMVPPQLQSGNSEAIGAVYIATGFEEAGQITTRTNANQSALFREKMRAAMRTGPSASRRLPCFLYFRRTFSPLSAI